MRENMMNKMDGFVIKCKMGAAALRRKGMKTEDGIDGILVTVGLCIIALLLCVTMKESLETFITGVVSNLTTEANEILTGTGV